MFCGYLKEHFRFDILSDSMERVPMLEVGAALSIHHMVVEDGGKQCVVTVKGGGQQAHHHQEGVGHEPGGSG